MNAPLHLAWRDADGVKPRLPRAPVTVVLADDHALIRRSLRLVLETEDGLDVVAEAADLDTVPRHVHGHPPHVVVLDLQMPGGSSIGAIRRLRQKVPQTEILVMTMERSPAFAQRALDAGAVGLLLKNRADTELAAAIRAAARGEEFVSPDVAAGLRALRLGPATGRSGRTYEAI
jgi:two-component system response regulator NreC